VGVIILSVSAGGVSAINAARLEPNAIVAHGTSSRMTMNTTTLLTTRFEIVMVELISSGVSYEKRFDVNVITAVSKRTRKKKSFGARTAV